MPILSKLDAEEQEILIHLIKNKNRSLNNQEQFTNDLTDAACSDLIKEQLAKVSEESNFANKNRYHLDNTVMQYAEKKRMPID